MDKIYSRKRCLLKPFFRNKKPISRKKVNIILKIVLIILIINFMFKLLYEYIDPMFEIICQENAKSLATIIINEQSTIVMNDYQYEELYSIEKDAEGKITVIKANVVPINNLMSDIAEKIQKEFNNGNRTNIGISVGSLSGLYVLSGMGPSIPVKVSILGNIETDVKSEFIAQGINQTLHRLYVVATCKMKVLTPLKSFETEVTNQVIIAEHVIIGDIPDTYYNLEGMTNSGETLNVID